MAKQRKKYGFLAYLIPALILIGILIYAVVNSLRIYIPQMREQDYYDLLKEKISTCPVYNSMGAPSGEPAYGETASVMTGNASAGITGEAAAETAGPATDDTIYEPPDETVVAEYDPFGVIYGINNDFRGWLTIPDTLIDYPVVKSSEDQPEYYLRRNFEKKKSISGCPFIGGGCDIDSDSFIIYEHNMNSDIMFGTLDKFTDADFARTHSDFTFDTMTESRGYRIFSAFQTKLYTSEGIFRYYDAVGKLSKEKYEEAVKNFRELSIIASGNVTVYPAQLLILSTCSYHTSDGRFVVVAYRVQ